MMGFSRTLGYAIEALACFEDIERSTELIRESEIASMTGVPKPYLAKIIHRLSRQGIVSTKRGPGGGLSLSRPAHNISILEVVKSIEGDQCFSNCMLGMDCCASSQYCPFTDFWNEIREKMETKLRETTLAEVIQFRKKASSGN